MTITRVPDSIRYAPDPENVAILPIVGMGDTHYAEGPMPLKPLWMDMARLAPHGHRPEQPQPEPAQVSGRIVIRDGGTGPLGPLVTLRFTPDAPLPADAPRLMRQAFQGMADEMRKAEDAMAQEDVS